MSSLRTARRARPITWITLIGLLLLAVAGRIEVRTCLGTCSEARPTEQASCCSTSDEAPAQEISCCGCCDDEGRSGKSDGGDSDGGDSEGRDSGCCSTVHIEVDQAPSSSPVQVPLATLCLCWVAPAPAAASCAHAATGPHRFERGPPRVDAGLVLRATQVLLI